jgi:uncharacterized protein HemX
MKKSTQKILFIGSLMFVLGGLNDQIIARNLDSAKTDSAQIATVTDTLKNQSEAPPQKSNEKDIQNSELTLRDWIALGAFIVGLSGLLFGFYQFLQRRKVKRDEKLVQLEAEQEFKKKEKELEQKECTQSAEEWKRQAFKSADFHCS